jgi:predicted outer membrane repeat protein
VKGVASDPATLSGGDATRIFLVFGKLVLEDIILKYGWALEFGGAILVDGLAGNLASTKLVRTQILECEAHGSGGGVAVIGAGATLSLDNGTVLSKNLAKKNGGAIYVAQGATMSVASSLTAAAADASVNVDVRLKNNAANIGGGALAVEHDGTQLIVAGPGVSLAISENEAQGSGGGIAVMGGATAIVERSAVVTIRGFVADGSLRAVDNRQVNLEDITLEKYSAAGGAGGLAVSNRGSKFVVRHSGTKLKVSGNTVQTGYAGGILVGAGAAMVSISRAHTQTRTQHTHTHTHIYAFITHAHARTCTHMHARARRRAAAVPECCQSGFFLVCC